MYIRLISSRTYHLMWLRFAPASVPSGLLAAVTSAGMKPPSDLLGRRVVMLHRPCDWHQDGRRGKLSASKKPYVPAASLAGRLFSSGSVTGSLSSADRSAAI